MRNYRHIAAAAVLLTFFAPFARGDERDFRWHSNLHAAQRQAQQTGKLVLIHFGAEWCNPCQRLEKNVFAKPGFGAALDEYYVGVKLDTDEHPSTVKMYAIGKIPCDIVMTPDGTVLHRQQSPISEEGYPESLVKAALAAKKRSAAIDGRSTADPDTAAEDARTRGRYSSAYVDPSDLNERDAKSAVPSVDASHPRPAWREMTEEEHRRSKSDDLQRRTASRYNHLRDQFAREDQPPTEEEQIAELEAQNADLEGEGEAQLASANMKTRDRGPRPDTVEDGIDELRPRNKSVRGGSTTSERRRNRPIRSEDQESPEDRESTDRADVAAQTTRKRVENPYLEKEEPTSETEDSAASSRVAARAPEIPAGNPPLALEGYSVVAMVEKTKWVLGDVRFGAIHRGRTYLFATEAEQKRFLAKPDHYAPVISGNDPVAIVEGAGAVAGERDLGLRLDGKLYFFASEANLEKFNADPERYVRGLRQAMKASTRRR